MGKITISKKVQPKYIKTEKGTKILNYENGRGVDVTFKSKTDYESKEAGTEYLMVLEQFLNDREIKFEASNYFVMGGTASVMLIVDESNLIEFDAAYSYFKSDYVALMQYYKNEAEQVERENSFEEMDAAQEQEISQEVEQEVEPEKFIFAGNAIFTLESEKTGNRYTYKVSDCKDKKDFYFVGLLAGSDNEHDYKYIGVIDHGNFRTTANSKLKKDSTPVIAFNFFLKKLDKINEIQGLKFYHAGRCGHCGRTLTTPESIKTGFGPVCMNRL